MNTMVFAVKYCGLALCFDVLQTRVPGQLGPFSATPIVSGGLLPEAGSAVSPQRH